MSETKIPILAVIGPTAVGKTAYSLDLAREPRELVEYVVVHELTHLRVHDHGPSFQTLMDARLPDWRLRRRQLRHTG